jgi:hypothetical protein
MGSSLSLWLIPALPLAGFFACLLLGKKLGKSFVSIAGAGSVGLATVVAYSRLSRSSQAVLPDRRAARAGSRRGLSADLAMRLDRSRRR